MKNVAKRTVSLVISAALLYPAVCVADTKAQPDVSLLTGFAIGTVTKRQVDRSNQTFQIGGVPLGLSWNHDISRDWSTALSGEFLLDAVNKQMIRQGFTGAIAYHLFGGGRRLDNLGDAIHVTATNSYNLSLLGRAGLFNYAASDPNSPSTSLAGGVWEIAMGVEYRKEVFDASALGASNLVSLTTLPASVERLSSRMNEVLFFWRYYW